MSDARFVQSASYMFPIKHKNYLHVTTISADLINRFQQIYLNSFTHTQFEYRTESPLNDLIP